MLGGMVRKRGKGIDEEVGEEGARARGGYPEDARDGNAPGGGYADDVQDPRVSLGPRVRKQAPAEDSKERAREEVNYSIHAGSHGIFPYSLSWGYF